MLGRLAGVLLTLAATSLAVFVLMATLPGDPARLVLGTDADPAAVAALRGELGLDRPLLVRYADWIGGVLTGDFGTSATYGVPVAGLVVERAVVSVPLAALALVLSVALALPLGLAAAVRRGTATDSALMGVAQVGLSLPNVWLGLILMLAFAVTWRLFPAAGFPGWEAPGAAVRALVLPAVALAVPQAAILARVVRAAVVEVADRDFVALARAKGRSRAGAVLRHALPNAWGPILVVIGLQCGFLVSGAALIETVFSLPGVGRLLFQAVAQRDVAVVQAVVLLFVATVVVANALADAAAGRAQPTRS